MEFEDERNMSISRRGISLSVATKSVSASRNTSTFGYLEKRRESRLIQVISPSSSEITTPCSPRESKANPYHYQVKRAMSVNLQDRLERLNIHSTLEESRSFDFSGLDKIEASNKSPVTQSKEFALSKKTNATKSLCNSLNKKSLLKI